MTKQYITLDCAPGTPRPDDLIEGVLEGTGYPIREPDSKFFGQYIWVYADIDPDVWLANQPTIKARIEALYHAGFIRYGDW